MHTILLYIFCLLSAQAIAAPEIAFPFNSQVPPAARVGQPYSFTLSPTTFKLNGETLNYTIAGAPPWLTLTSGKPTLVGMPGAGDVGTVTFTITAGDPSGSTAMPCTLVVVAFSGPQLGAPIDAQLAKAGNLSGTRTLTYFPQTPFGFSLNSDTFTESEKDMSYYATLGDHIPLPGWLNFDPESIRFSGTTPAINQSPQSFNILLIASDVVGFAGIAVEFTIYVSVHKFTFSQQDRTVNVEPGQDCNVRDLRSQLLLDGKPVGDSDYGTASANAPPWLHFDPQSLALTGTPPTSGQTQDVDISITASDKYGDTTNTTVHLKILSGLFTGSVGTLNATAGQQFHYALNPSLFVRSDMKVSVDFGPASSWLHFNSSDLTVYGTVPANAPTGPIKAELKVATPGSSAEGHLDFEIVVTSEQQGQPTSTISGRSTQANTSTSSPTPTGFAQGSPDDTGQKKGTKHTAGITIGIIVTVIFAILCLAVSCWYCRTPREGILRTRSALKRSISRPIITEEDHQAIHNSTFERGNSETPEPDLEKGSDELERTPEHPPQIVLEFSPRKSMSQRNSHPLFNVSPSKKADSSHLQPSAAGNRLSAAENVINKDDAAILDSINRTSWGYGGATSNKHKPHDSMKLATQIARAPRQVDSDAFTVSRRYQHQRAPSTLLSRRSSSHRSNGLPVSRRLIGIGHGRASPSDNRNSIVFSSVSQRHSNFTILSTSDDRSNSFRSNSAGGSTGPPPPPHNSLHLSRQLSPLSDSRFSLSDRPSRTSHPAQRPVPRRLAYRSPFFAGGPSTGGAARWSHNSNSLRSPHRSTVLGLSTITGSPDLGSEATNDQENVDPTKKDIGPGRGPSCLAAQTPSPNKPTLRRINTQMSQKTSRTWQTTTSGGLTGLTTRSASSELLAPPTRTLPTPPSHRRWSKAGPQRPVSDVSLSARSSILFLSADDLDSSFEHEPSRLPREASGSLYSQSEGEAEAECPSPTRRRSRIAASPGITGLGLDPGIEPTDVHTHMKGLRPLATLAHKAADRLDKTKAAAAARDKRKSASSMRDISIIDRPRSSFRPPGARGNTPSPKKQRLPLINSSDGKREPAKLKKRERVERPRLVSGKGKRPVSHDGKSRVGSQGGELEGADVRGNEAFL